MAGAGVAEAADASSEISNAPKTGRDYSAEEGRGGGWFTDFHGRQGGSWQWHGLGIKPTALLLVRPKLSLLVGPVNSTLADGSLSILQGERKRERHKEGIIRCVRQYGLRVLSPGVSCARGRP